MVSIMTAIGLNLFGHFKKKSIAAEAKIALSEIYVAEASAYYSYETYMPCLEMIGVNEKEGTYFSTGFTGSMLVDRVLDSTAGTEFSQDCMNAEFNYVGKKLNAPDLDDYPQIAIVSPTGYAAIAVASRNTESVSQTSMQI